MGLSFRAVPFIEFVTAVPFPFRHHHAHGNLDPPTPCGKTTYVKRSQITRIKSDEYLHVRMLDSQYSVYFGSSLRDCVTSTAGTNNVDAKPLRLW